MSNGLIQQCDTPLEVYRNPVNRFVAAFVGTPPMNFFEGTLERGAAGLEFVEGSSDPSGKPYRLPVPASKASRVENFVGKPIVLGLRPQMLTHRPESGTTASSITMQVKVVEPLGDQMDVACLTPKHAHIVARLHAFDGVKAGQSITLHVDMDAAHFFEPGEFGKNLLR
jgi:multiple sugar transport system ATP-binding protein